MSGIDRGRWSAFTDEEIYQILRGLKPGLAEGAERFARAGSPDDREDAQVAFEALYGLIKELGPIVDEWEEEHSG